MTDFTCFGWPPELFIPNLDTSEEVKLIKYEEPVPSWVYNDLSTSKISKVKMDFNSYLKTIISIRSLISMKK